MVGSLLSNLWAALIAFTLYFGLSYPFVSPVAILFGSSIWAIVFFLFTFVVRYLLFFVWQPPFQADLDDVKLSEGTSIESEQANYSSKEMTSVVKQMLDDK